MKRAIFAGLLGGLLIAGTLALSVASAGSPPPHIASITVAPAAHVTPTTTVPVATPPTPAPPVVAPAPVAAPERVVTPTTTPSTTTPTTVPAPATSTPTEPAQPPAIDASTLSPGTCGIAVNSTQQNPVNGQWGVYEVTYRGSCDQAQKLANLYPGATVVSAPG